MVKTLYSAKQSRRGVNNWRKSPVIQDLRSNKKIATTLNEKREIREFHDKFKKKFKGHKVTTTGMKEFMWELKQDKKDSLSDKEVGIIARQIIRSGKKYLRPDGQADYQSKTIADKNKPIPPAAVNRMGDIKSTAEKIKAYEAESAKKVGLPMVPESFFQNARIVDEVTKKNGEEKAEGKKSIYDIIRERNSGSN